MRRMENPEQPPRRVEYAADGQQRVQTALSDADRRALSLIEMGATCVGCRWQRAKRSVRGRPLCDNCANVERAERSMNRVTAQRNCVERRRAQGGR